MSCQRDSRTNESSGRKRKNVVKKENVLFPHVLHLLAGGNFRVFECFTRFTIPDNNKGRLAVYLFSGVPTQNRSGPIAFHGLKLRWMAKILNWDKNFAGFCVTCFRLDKNQTFQLARQNSFSCGSKTVSGPLLFLNMTRQVIHESARGNCFPRVESPPEKSIFTIPKER